MTVVVKNHIIGLEITVDDISLVQVLKGEQDLSDVQLCTLFCKPPLLGNNLSKIATWAEVENQKQLGLALECVVEVDNEWMAHVRQNVTFCLRVSHEVLPQNLALAKGLHCI